MLCHTTIAVGSSSCLLSVAVSAEGLYKIIIGSLFALKALTCYIIEVLGGSAIVSTVSVHGTILN